LPPLLHVACCLLLVAWSPTAAPPAPPGDGCTGGSRG